MAENFQPVFAKFLKGAYIFFEGYQNADKFYIIKEGKVQISRETDWETSEVIGPGGMFGVVSVMASHSYIDTAIALTDVVLIVVERKNYGDLICKNNSIAINTITLFSQRLRKLDEELSKHTLKSTAADNPSHLYQVGLFFEKAGKSNQALYAYRQYLAHCPKAGNINEVKGKMAKLRPAFNQPQYPPDTMAQTFPKDSLVFAEGEKSNNLYVIQNGSVKISKIVNNQEVVLAVLGKGDIFGEMALLEDKPRSATAEVYEDCTLLAVNQANFSRLINDKPDLVVRITSLMSERIWLLYRQLANTTIENPVWRISDALLTQLEKNRVDLTLEGQYQCNFGFKELAGMAGIPEHECGELYRRIAANKNITQVNDKLYINNVNSLYNEADYYRRKTKKA